MARLSLLIIAVCQILSFPTGGNTEGESPLLDLASAFLQNMGDSDNNNNANGLAAIGSLVGTLMQGDNAKNLGALFGQNGGDAGDMISGLGSLLGGNQGGIDPALIGSMISMFSQQMGDNERPKAETSRRKRESGIETIEKPKQKDELNIDGIIGIATSFLQSKNAAKILPVLVNTISAFSGSETRKLEHNHEDHATFLPPFVEKLHLYWDLFSNSDLGKAVWQKVGIDGILKSFKSPDGSINIDLIMTNLENHAFRRHWIKTAAIYLADTMIYLTKPEVYQTYFFSGQFVVNGFLDAQGFSRKAQLNLSKPAESISAIIHEIFKKYLDMDTDVSDYVKPGVEHVKKIMILAQRTSQHLHNENDYNILIDMFTDTLNLEVIEPVLRVYRAYKHSVGKPQCQEHLICLVNRHHDSEKKGLPGFKVAITKFSSMVASAALSFQNGKGFWDLYNAIQDDVNCEAKYPADCSTFHEHELKVTTEVYHSEL